VLSSNKKIGVSVKKNNLVLCAALLALISLSLYSQPVSLAQCRKQALISNRNIKIAQESVASAESNKKASTAFFFPKIDLLATYSYFPKPVKYEMELGLKEKLSQFLTGMAQLNPAVTTDPFFQTLTQMGGALPSNLELKLGEKNNYLASFSLAQPVFTGGKIIQQYKISKYLENIAQQTASSTEEEIIEKTDEYYYKLLSVKEKINLAQKYVDMIKSHLNDLNNMQEAGLITQNEILKAKVKLNEAELNLFKAQNGYTLASMALNQIIGNPLNTEISPADSVITITEIDYNKLNPQKRSEIAMLENLIKINNSLKNVAFSSYLPNIVLQANYAFINPNPFNSFENEFGSTWQINLVGQWEIFHANERYHRLSEAKHAERIAQYKLDDAKEMIQLDIEQNKLKLNEALKRVEMTNTGVKQAEDNLRICNDKFKEGLISASEVLDAQTLWTQAVSNKIEADTDYCMSITKLYKALGILKESNLGE
jgi:outer membrane protein TolC